MERGDNDYPCQEDEEFLTDQMQPPYLYYIEEDHRIAMLLTWKIVGLHCPSSSYGGQHFRDALLSGW